MPGRALHDINLIVIHCSATPNGRWNTPTDIDQWHAKRGFKRDMSIDPVHEPRLKHIGYHHIVGTNGAIWSGRSLREPGEHVRDHNANSVGIVMVGIDAYTPDAWESLSLITRNVLRRLLQAREGSLWPYQHSPEAVRVPELAERAGIRICGHRDLSPDKNKDGKIDRVDWLKTCPGFVVADWLKGGMVPLKGHIITAPVKTA